MEQEYYTTNNVAMIVKRIAVLVMIIGIITSVIILFAEVVEVIVGVIILVTSIIAPLMFYAIGEIIETLHDIKTNSEHIRDYLEKRG